jgi:hypothetical protein
MSSGGTTKITPYITEYKGFVIFCIPDLYQNLYPYFNLTYRTLKSKLKKPVLGSHPDHLN